MTETTEKKLDCEKKNLNTGKKIFICPTCEKHVRFFVTEKNKKPERWIEFFHFEPKHKHTLSNLFNEIFENTTLIEKYIVNNYLCPECSFKFANRCLDFLERIIESNFFFRRLKKDSHFLIELGMYRNADKLYSKDDTKKEEKD